jgi:hypothetical protein
VFLGISEIRIRQVAESKHFQRVFSQMLHDWFSQGCEIVAIYKKFEIWARSLPLRRRRFSLIGIGGDISRQRSRGDGLLPLSRLHGADLLSADHAANSGA